MNKNILIQALRENTTTITADRLNDPLHASDLDNPYCARQQYYRYAHKNKKKIQSSFLTYTFDIGHKIEDLIRLNYLREYMWGHWHCICTPSSSFIYGPNLYPNNPDKTQYYCENCHCAGLWQYKEYVFFCKELGLECSVDALLRYDKKLYVLEIKSMNENDFKKLDRPLFHHAERTNIYLNCLKYSKISVEDTAFVLYCAKSSGIWTENGVFPFQIFEVPYKNIEKEIKQKTQSFYEALETKVLPQRICETMDDKPAKSCPFVFECFNLKHL